MAAKKSSPKKAAAKKKPGDDGMLAKYEHHRSMAEKHRAHADLIEAKLRTQGKEIRTHYPGDSPMTASAPRQRKIVPVRT
jgi:hypothetical protein